MLELLWRSFYISTLGTLLASFLALPLAYYIARREFWARGFLVALMQALMGLPPVVVGLGLYMLFRPEAAFGALGWLYSVKIMVLAQVLIVIPIVFSLSLNAFQFQYLRLRDFFSSFPLNRGLKARLLFAEASPAVIAAILAGFGRAIGEVGAVLIVGGNLQARTDVLTTVIVEETSKGNIAFAGQLGLMLLALAFLVSLLAWRAGKWTYG